MKQPIKIALTPRQWLIELARRESYLLDRTMLQEALERLLEDIFPESKRAG